MQNRRKKRSAFIICTGVRRDRSAFALLILAPIGPQLAAGDAARQLMGLERKLSEAFRVLVSVLFVLYFRTYSSADRGI